MYSLRFKILLLTLAPLIIVLLVIDGLSVYNKYQTERQLLSERLDTYRTLLESGDLALDTTQDKAKIQAILNEKVQFAEILDPNYTVLYTTENSAAPLISNAEKKEVDEAFQGIEITKNADLNGKSVFVIISPLIVNGTVVAVIHQGLSNVESDQRIQQYAIYISVLTLIGIIVCFVLIYVLLSKAVLENIDKLRKATVKMEKGDLSVAAEVNANDEIGALALSFNQMATKLKEYYGELENKVSERTLALEKAKTDLEKSLADATALEQAVKEERNRIQAIVNSMGEGLFAVDKDSKVILMNPAAEKLFEVSGQQVIGRKIDEIVPKIFRDGKESPTDRPSARTLAGASVNITVDDNISFGLISGKQFPVAVATTPLRGESGITGVIEVFRDITSEKQSRTAIEQQVIERTKELQQKNIALTAAKEEISRGWLQIQMEKARLLASVNSITLGFLIVDVNGKTLIKNTAVEKTIGIKADYSNIDLISQLLGPAFGLKEKFNKCVEERVPIDVNSISFNNKFFHLFVGPIFSTDNTLTIIGVVILIENETQPKAPVVTI